MLKKIPKHLILMPISFCACLSLTACTDTYPQSGMIQDASSLLPPAQGYTVDQNSKTHSNSNSSTQSSSNTINKTIPNGEATHTSANSTTKTSGTSVTKSTTVVIPNY